jgi:hypothetical protein
MSAPNVRIRNTASAAVGLLMVGALVACSGGPANTPVGPTKTPVTAPSPQPTVPDETTRCAVTIPRPAVLPHVSADHLFGSDRAHGNGKLWAGGLGANGVIKADPTFVDDDGSVWWKVGWWRAIPGRLSITGQRLDGSAPGLRVEVPSGYGRTGFQSSGLRFPTGGCWEVTGKVGSTTLRFVTRVVKT